LRDQKGARGRDRQLGQRSARSDATGVDWWGRHPPASNSLAEAVGSENLDEESGSFRLLVFLAF